MAVFLTHRFLDDLQEIRSYSEKEWGEQTALDYIEDIQDTLQLLEGNPSLPKINTTISERFKTYPVNKHWLICDEIDGDIYMLTVQHTSMDLLEQLRTREPYLEEEAKLLYQQITGQNK